MINKEKQQEIFHHIINNYDLSKFDKDVNFFEDTTINKVFKSLVKGYEYSQKLVTNINKLYELCNEDVDIYDIKNILDFKPTTDRQILKHETYEYFKNKQKEIDEYLYEVNVSKDPLESTPYLNLDCLPNIFTIILDKIRDRRQKDIFFLGMITNLSVLLDNFFFYNTYFTTLPNIYTFIGAQAASGKGMVNNTRLVLNKYIKEEIQKNDALMVDYYGKIEEFTNKKSTSKIELPKLSQTIISANTSTAKLYDVLNNNRNNTGLLYTTEVGELSANNKNDWGGYDIILREGFHNEPISNQRVSGVNVNIEKPYISVLASGTMDQYVDMFAQKTTNGLFSRCLFYIYKTDLYMWEEDDERFNRNKELSFTDFIKKQSDVFYDMFRYYSNFDKVEVDISLEAHKEFNNYFKNLNINNIQNYDEDISSTNRRLASICKRVLMIITAVRYYQNNIGEISDILSNSFNSMWDDSKELKIISEDSDVLLAIDIMDKIIQHTLLLYSTLDYNIDKKKVVIKQNDNFLALNDMPDEFNIKTLKDHAKTKYDISPVSIQSFIQRCVKSKKIKPMTKRGFYKKI